MISDSYTLQYKNSTSHNETTFSIIGISIDNVNSIVKNVYTCMEMLLNRIVLWPLGPIYL